MYFLINILIILIILQSFLVIISKNSVTSVLYLIGAYVLTSFIFLILGAEFLSIILVIIYVGAVSILFIFVIMMLNVRVVEVYNTIINYIPIGLFIGCFFFGELMYMIYIDFGMSSYMGSNSYTSN
jgi:NADH:ubiquinone oxidoreductase subunit 6 (subunit J)